MIPVARTDASSGVMNGLISSWPDRLIAVVAVLAGAIIAAWLINRVVSRVYWDRVLAGQAPERVEQLRRNQRQQSIISLVHSMVRYLIYGGAVVFSAVLITGGAASAVLGASLLAVVIGFGVQRVLADVVAGTLLLFEGHYAVGDYIRIHQLGLEGIVEEFTVRSTVLRTMSGDRAVVMNSSITAVTRLANASRDLRIEFVSRGTRDRLEVDVQSVLRLAMESPNHHFLVPPELMACEPVEHIGHEPLHRIEIRAVTPPTQEWLVDQWLVHHLARVLDERLVGTIDVIDIAEVALGSMQGAALVAQATDT